MKKYLQSCKTDFWKKVFEAELNYLLRELGNGKDVLSVGCGSAIIEAEAARYFSVRSEYFLGIEGTRVYPCDDSYGASLCVIKGTKKRRVENVSIGEDIVIES
jgi:hypothetical protein